MPTTTTPLAGFTAAIGIMSHHEKLMLIDLIGDQLPDHLVDALAEGLAAAFEQVGEQFPSGPIYPAGAIKSDAWAKWRAIRDERLARKMGEL